MLAVLFGMTWAAIAGCAAGPRPLSRHGGQRAGADRVSCVANAGAIIGAAFGKKIRVQPHAQDRH
jgi:hypothetical protein